MICYNNRLLQRWGKPEKKNLYHEITYEVSVEDKVRNREKDH